MSEEDAPERATFRSIQQMRKMLLNLSRWLDKAEAHARARSFDPVVLLTARLAPDQIPLLRQIQNACDKAKFAAARLTGREAPRHPDTEQTMAELHARIAVCVGYLETFAAEDLRDAGSRTVEIPFLDEKVIDGRHYLTEMAEPGFYFHLTTAYAILRHNGVDLTMRDFIGATNVRDR